VDDVVGIRPDALFRGEFGVVGIEHEYKLTRKRRNYDGYEQRVWQKLENSIEPSPADSLRMRRAKVDHVECAVIEVLKPLIWFWPKGDRQSVLHVKRGNRTMSLKGKEMDDYMRRHDVEAKRGESM
jgi:hypothetical protein